MFKEEANDDNDVNDALIRASRLRRFEGLETSLSSTPSKRGKTEESDSQNPEIDATTKDSLAKVLYLNGGATAEDMVRWCEQGFEFSKSLPNFQFGLKQGLGGPCGVLAAVQAEMIGSIFFNGDGDGDVDVDGGGDASDETVNNNNEFPRFSSEQLQHVLARALVAILSRATKENSPLKLVSVDEEGVFTGFQTDHDVNLRLHNFDTPESATAFVVENINMYAAQHGCILFLIGLLLTRGLEQVKADMDMDDTTLIGQFGHCTQEIVNLLLTGRATGNVMDGDVPMGDSGLTVRGVKKQSYIGYLTHLEALQLCQVGSFYKQPEVPIWVVGSSSHFTVVFCTDKTVNEESESEKLRTKVQRAFKSVDMEECGFIATDKVALALMNIDEPVIYEILGDEDDIGRLRGHMTSDGGIVIWGTFWEAVSRLITGAALDDLINDKAAMDSAVAIAAGMGDQAYQGIDQNLGAMTGLPRSDSDLARELQRQFDDPNPNGDAINLCTNEFASIVPPPALESTVGTMHRSDSDLARELQRQFDADMEAMPPLAPLPNTEQPKLEPIAVPAVAAVEIEAKPKEPETKKEPVAEKEHEGEKEKNSPSGFTLFHFNGLENSTRPARLSRFTLRRKEAEDVTGQSVAMTGGSGGTAYLNPLEEVIRTRWNGCSLDFGTQSVPSID